jgi:hypothetical protein
VLQFDNPFQVAVQPGDVENATVLLCRAELVRVAALTGIRLEDDSLYSFTQHIERVIRDSQLVVTPTQLINQAQLYAMRGAQRMLEDHETRFHEWTWDAICPFWPFC